MKNPSNTVHIIALAACFAVHYAMVSDSHLSGIRRALQTMTGPADETMVPERQHALPIAPLVAGGWKPESYQPAQKRIKQRPSFEPAAT
ncbi:hypothetical protein [Chelativorans salis]|uniref:Uncharacterized protein n=1 Tax=Chelativorans salis TaxID=2978478 RepID=A0ABT2LUR8_9HYPH|nr:hypothetical protein [Chelativorans sp. EGI FJ00035]MCT7378275.1 hypothetical protein [Chelativorans sp. EGI FJ00035]